ncbi:putative toxin [Buttiauxella ferragutiae ATCC 51602]|jgi:putative addiction module killer protein|uniref:Toxin n=3 Tax=Buttiauxella TaxID=82976 RepID=A0ABX2W283_9ENTR|nr:MULTISPECIES: type II toxin-antitoxin system RelE/ParE family toxin [Buttiauxella]MCE0825071.1 type II toxin-antitoxin system RelE/ParE family toxin [Buttiauxella ferragutiae]OAT24623.1 putative toxin [Buttiauxella ferragutiae ATCC 51602]TDN51826.1 putative addiction module killer protein [Buttiauxella sp. JUb87]UNK60320.1 type II toxin-antitoxin system RelE/ParE family toxin [Buttiauxella ferragutiae]
MNMIKYFKLQNGRVPFNEWLKVLRDPRAKTKIVRRIDQLALNNPGDHKPCRHGVWEMRIDEGPGYRIYYAYEGKDTYLLLLGGDKRKQQADIEQAVTWWQEHQELKNAI